MSSGVVKAITPHRPNIKSLGYLCKYTNYNSEALVFKEKKVVQLSLLLPHSRT